MVQKMYNLKKENDWRNLCCQRSEKNNQKAFKKKNVKFV